MSLKLNRDFSAHQSTQHGCRLPLLAGFHGQSEALASVELAGTSHLLESNSISIPLNRYAPTWFRNKHTAKLFEKARAAVEFGAKISITVATMDHPMFFFHRNQFRDAYKSKREFIAQQKTSKRDNRLLNTSGSAPDRIYYINREK